MSRASRSATGKSPALAQVPGRLQVERQRIVDRGRDAVRQKMRPELLPVRHANHEHVIGRLIAGIAVRARHGRRKHLAVPIGHLAPPRVPAFESVGLHAQHGRLQRVETSRLPGDGMFVLAHPPVVAQQPRPVLLRGIVGRHEPGVAEGAAVLGWIETEAAGGRQRTGDGSLVPRPVSLGRVFDDGNTRSGIEDLAHRRRTAVQVHGNDGFVLGPIARSSSAGSD